MAQATHKDVVVALLGASAGLAGLVLVFLGVVVTSLQSFGGDTPRTVLRRYRYASAAVLGAFTAGVLVVGTASLWLVSLDGHRALYLATVWLFGAQVITLLLVAIWIVWQFVWK